MGAYDRGGKETTEWCASGLGGGGVVVGLGLGLSCAIGPCLAFSAFCSCFLALDGVDVVVDSHFAEAECGGCRQGSGVCLVGLRLRHLGLLYSVCGFRHCSL